MVPKFPDDNKPKTSLKKWIRTTSSMLLTSIKFVKCWRNCPGFNPERPYLRRKKEENLFTHSIPDAAVQWRLRNVQKGAMHVHSCCFADVNLLLFSFRIAVAVVLLKLLLVAIQKFCYHGNVTSHFSSLFCRNDMRPILFLKSLVIIGLPSVLLPFWLDNGLVLVIIIMRTTCGLRHISVVDVSLRYCVLGRSGCDRFLLGKRMN